MLGVDNFINRMSHEKPMISVTQKPARTGGISLISRPRFMRQTPRF